MVEFDGKWFPVICMLPDGLGLEIVCKSVYKRNIMGCFIKRKMRLHNRIVPARGKLPFYKIFFSITV